MRIIIFLLSMFISVASYAGTCSSISRTNNSANAVLTSTKYNTDHNTAYNFLNAYDGGCITDGTLEDGSLNTTDFAVPLNAHKAGCKITRTDADTISVDRCMLSVNGSWVRTTSATTVDMGCATNCSAEAASTDYYVYAINGSSGSTLTLGLQTSAPNNDGYTGSGDRVLGRFFNDADLNIATTSLETFVFGNYVPHVQTVSARVDGDDGTPDVPGNNGEDLHWIESVTDNGTGNYRINFVSGFWAAAPRCTGSTITERRILGTDATATYVDVALKTDGGTAADEDVYILCTGLRGNL